MVPVFSIIMPALRPQMVEQTLKRIYATPSSIKYEIVIVSPEHFSGPNIVYVHEETPRGNGVAHLMGAQAAHGDFFLCMTDDMLPEPGWLDGVAERLTEKERRYFPFAAGFNTPGHGPGFGTVYGLYYPYFPVASRRSVEAAGGWFGISAYKSQWIDPDFGMRVWHAGGRCEILLDNRIVPNPSEDPETFSPHRHAAFWHDFTVFYTTWHAHYGAPFMPGMPGHTDEEVGRINYDYPLAFLTDDSFTERAPPDVVLARLGHRLALPPLPESPAEPEAARPEVPAAPPPTPDAPVTSSRRDIGAVSRTIATFGKWSRTSYEIITRRWR